MTRALTQVDGMGTPFWMFLIQAFFVVLVTVLAIALGFLMVARLYNWADRRGWLD